MERGRDREQHRAPRPLPLGDLDRALNRGLVAGDHDLAAAIVVRGLDDLALRGFRRDLCRLLELDADERRHRAHPDRHRLLHGAAADAHEAHRVGERQRAGRGER